jgi:S1-C subfamily serine protease
MRRLILLCILVLIAICQPYIASATTKKSHKSNQAGSSASATPYYTTQQLVARFAPSVVKVTAFGSDGSVLANGCGIVYYDDEIATSLHVINGASAVKVTFASGKSENATSVKGWRTRRHCRHERWRR